MTLEEAKALKPKEEKPEKISPPGKDIEIVLGHIRRTVADGEDDLHISTAYYIDDAVVAKLKDLQYTVEFIGTEKEILKISGW